MTKKSSKSPNDSLIHVSALKKGFVFVLPSELRASEVSALEVKDASTVMVCPPDSLYVVKCSPVNGPFKGVEVEILMEHNREVRLIDDGIVKKSRWPFFVEAGAYGIGLAAAAASLAFWPQIQAML
jgi:hypothetical protein